MVASTTEYSHLETQCRSLLKVLRNQARRAFLLEITGTPKAGKTTSIATLESFFKSCGFRVHVLRERAAECPLPMKGHFFFNAWTTCTMIAEVLAIVDTKVDLLILDRGYFDALIWLQLQYKRGQVTEKEMSTFTDFVLLERWRSLVDLTVIMKTDPEEAVRRENVNRIIPRQGSMMNLSSLSDFNAALETVIDKYSSSFHFEFVKSNPGDGIVETNAALAQRLLQKIENWADPLIAVLPKDFIVQQFGDRQIKDSSFISSETWLKLEKAILLKKRSLAETDPNIVQIVACGVHTHESKVFLFQRSPSDEKASRYGHHTIWKGCHIATDIVPNLDHIQRCLKQRIRSDLHLAIELDLSFLGLVWNSEIDQKHLGLVFEVPLHSSAVATSMKQKEFRTSGRGHELTGDFWPPRQLSDDKTLRLEPWSRQILAEDWIKVQG